MTSETKPAIRSATAAVFDRWRARIDDLLASSADMGVVEHAIAVAHALDGEEKDALWLWASGRRDRHLDGAPEPPVIGGTTASRRLSLGGAPSARRRSPEPHGW